MRRSRTVVVGTFVLAVLTAACGNDGDDSDAAASTTRPSTSTTTSTPATSTTAAAASTTTTTPLAPCPPLEGGTTGLTEVASTTAPALLRDVQLATGDCTDSVSFTFDAAATDAPGHRIEYVPGPITQDGSGEPVAVEGGAYLSVRFEPAYGYDFDTGEDTYTGPDRVTSPNAFFVREVVQTGDFEAVVSWVIGIDQQRPYVVTATGTTTRTITIDIR